MLKLRKGKKTISIFISLMLASSLSNAAFASAPDGAGSKEMDSLSQEERALINAKKDAILYLLLENDELEPYLQAVKKQAEEKAKKEELERKFPYSHNEITQQRKLGLDLEKANNAPIINKEVRITEEPFEPDDRKPIVLNVASNNPSSMSFFDYEGNPWPIAGDVIGDPSAYSSSVFTEDKNVVVFSIKKRFSESVALVNLQGLKNLVVVKLKGDEGVIDSDKRIRLSKLSPLVEKEIYPNQSNSDSGKNDPFFDNLISGDYRDIKGVKELFVKNNPDRNNIYVEKDGYLYLRIRNELIFPGHLNHHVSSNDFHLYKLKKADTLTILVNGEYLIYTLSEEV
jgi:hypothetical protein